MEDIINETLAKGVELHLAGELDLASKLYGSVIKLEPKHADANHNMGLLKLDKGHDLDALPYLQMALQADTSIAQFWLSYINALIKLERRDEAARIISLAKENGMEGEEFLVLSQKLSAQDEVPTIIERRADTANKSKSNILDKLKLDKALNLAKTKTKTGSFKEAKLIYQDIVEKSPKTLKAQKGIATLNKTHTSADAQHPNQHTINELMMLYDKGELGSAIEGAEIILKQYPKAFNVWNILGAANKRLGKLDNALKAFEKVTLFNPEYAQGFNNLGTTFQDQGKFEEAMHAYNKALSLKPDFAEAHFNLGNALKNQDRLVEAIEEYNRAISIRPDYAEAHNNLGIVFTNQGQFEEALEAYKKAISAKSEYYEAFNNMGFILRSLGKLDESLEAHKQAISIKPDYADAHENFAFALLNSGKIEEGLDEYEWRWKTREGLLRQRHFLQPRWEAKESLKGKKIFFWCEQGIGDTIKWSSQLSLPAEQADHCLLECPEKLVPLLSRSFPNVEVRAENRRFDSVRDDFDFHLPLGSLYKQNLLINSQNYRTKAFLIPDNCRVEFWKKRLKALGDGPYIGISWKSSNMNATRLPNYAPISALAPLLMLPGVTFINLQYKDYKKDLTTIQNDFGIRVNHFDDLDQFNDIDDVAALTAALDFVVSTKLIAPMISAGVGTITKLANWRHSSWSNILHNPVGPSIDIFEKNSWESWDAVFHAIASDIAKL